MIVINILYPNQPGSRFDWDYYLKTHMPSAIERLSAGEGYRGVQVVKGASGPLPGSEPAYAAMCHFTFTSAEAFLAAFMPHAGFLQGDIPNYTNVAPVMQISEILIS